MINIFNNLLCYRWESSVGRCAYSEFQQLDFHIGTLYVSTASVINIILIMSFGPPNNLITINIINKNFSVFNWQRIATEHVLV